MSMWKFRCALVLLVCLLLLPLGVGGGAVPPAFAGTPSELLAVGPPQLGAAVEEPSTAELDLEQGLPPSYAPWLEERLSLWRSELETLREQGRLSTTELLALEKRIEEAEVLHRLQTHQSLSPDQERALMRQVYAVERLLERLLTGLDAPAQAP